MVVRHLLLVRHGNTFAPGDKVVWVGARTDLPLVESGRRQASDLGTRLAELGQRPEKLFCGPLKRTAEHAAIVRDILGAPADIALCPELREIDYGAWEARSTDEIRDLGYADELEAWDRSSVWPTRSGWPGTAADLAAALDRFLAGILADPEAALQMAVTSNGILRFFPRLTRNYDAAANYKTATGACCLLRHDGTAWEIVFWNRKPADLTGW